MGLYEGGTFRVGHIPTFAFIDADGETYYPNAKAMWSGVVDWQVIKNRAGGKGTEAGAKKIEIGLRHLNQDLKGDNDLMEDEVNMIKDILGASRQSALFDFAGGLSGRKRGEQFEQRFANLVERLTEETENSGPVAVGAQQQRAPIEIGVVANTKGRGKKADLWQIVKDDMGVEFRDLIGKANIAIKEEFENGDSHIVIRQAKAPGKVDADADGRVSFKITSEVSKEVQDMADELAGHTFSLKNYKKSTMQSWGGIGLGYANKFRAYGSFYYAATGSNNFADMCTFIFASENSKSKEVKRYLSWARFIYELTGLGLQDYTDSSTGRVVDYLIVNTADAGINDIRVYATSQLIAAAPSGEPPAGMKNITFTNWKGETFEGQKFIFSMET